MIILLCRLLLCIPLDGLIYCLLGYCFIVRIDATNLCDFLAPRVDDPVLGTRLASGVPRVHRIESGRFLLSPSAEFKFSSDRLKEGLDHVVAP
jgi:hypothetical protein